MNQDRSTEDALRAAALSWHVKLTGGEASERDFLAFEQWVRDPAARAAYDEIESVSAEVEVHRGVIATALAAEEAARGKSAGRERRGRANPPWFVGWAVGGLAFAGALAAALIVWPQFNAPWRSYSVAKGGSEIVRLADGTIVQLNSGSSLRVSIGPRARRIEMAEGEAAFVVAQDAGRPFTVEVGGRRIRDVGTDFSVLHHLGRSTITVRSGLVDVAALRGESKAIRLSAGDQLVCETSCARPRQVDVESALAWQKGRLIYTDARLADVASDLNRYFLTPVVVETGAADLRFSGVLTLDSEERVVQRLQAFLPVRAQTAGGQVTISAIGR